MANRKMEYRNLGRSGLRVSALSFGSWITFGNQIQKDTARALMETAYEAGVNFFDNSEAYAEGRSEEQMGQILKELNWPRDSYILSSKAFFGIKGLKDSLPTQKGNNRKHLTEACHQALRRLQTDYLDLFFCHRPDKHTPIEETVWTMHNLIQQGKVLYWGTSEWSAQEIMEAHMVARQYNLIGPVMEQPQYNMLFREKVENEFRRLYHTVGLGSTVWSPLASGVLTGKYNHGVPEKSRLGRSEMQWLAQNNLREDFFERVRGLQKIADEKGLSLPVMAIAWTLKNPHVSTTILGASSVEQLQENLTALEALPKLDEATLTAIEKVLDNKPVPPPF